MREILFRGKREDNGEWVDGDLRHGGYYFGDAKMYIFVPFAHTIINHPVVPETVGQYTGLKDKNGKRIFEGDILDHYAQSDIIVNRGVVFWDEKNARWAHKLRTMNPCFYMYKSEAFEIIGNIHDNPELLGGDNA